LVAFAMSLHSSVWCSPAFVGGDYDHLSYTPESPLDPKKHISIRFVNALIEFLSKIGGRDKLARTLQYTMKVIGPAVDALHPLGAKNDVTPRLNNLATGLAHGRRVIRIGNLPQQFKDIYTSWTQEKLPVVQLFSTASKVSSLCFLFIDHTEWVSRSGVFPMLYDYWGWWTALFWLLGALFGAIVNVYLRERARLAEELARRKLAKDAAPADVPKLAQEIDANRVVQQKQLIDLARNLCDVIMASNGVHKWQNVPQWIFPVFGIASSFIGSYQTFPAFK